MADAPRSPIPEASAPRTSRKKLVVVGAACLVAAIGAGIVLTAPGEEPPESGEEPQAENAGDPAGISLEPFVLNLADEQSERYLRVAIHVVLDRREVAEAATAESLHGARLRDRLLALLSGKTADDLESFEGKEALRAEVRRTAESLLEDARVLDVYFTEFLIQ